MPRKHERSTFLTEIILESASGKREARISDVSEGGCFVDTIVTVRPGEEVSLTGTLDSGERLDVKGKVAYVLDGFGFGVEFIELSDTSRQAVNKMINN
jgi:Tfp pilus assembly protein PilZ